MRDAIAKLGGDPQKINPLVPVHLVIDHSVMVDEFGTPKAFEKNVELEYQAQRRALRLPQMGQPGLDNFKVVPPGTGICHQVNLEHIAQCVWTGEDQDGETVAYPDTCVGTDSHTTMVNGLGVLGWGVGGIEAEAAMLGQPVCMLIPEVVGFRLTGELDRRRHRDRPGADRHPDAARKGVVGRFVEFFGPGLASLPLADRATLANMAPEYGATCGFFGIDERRSSTSRLTGRGEEQIALVEAYARRRACGASRPPDPVFTDTLELDMATRRALARRAEATAGQGALRRSTSCSTHELEDAYGKSQRNARAGRWREHDIGDGDVVIAAITSCTNTSNPDVLIAAGLVAKKAREKGLKPKPWVKTSLAPGSQVVTDYLDQGRAAGGPRRARLRPRRLRLHHLHRQLRPAGRADLQGDQRQRYRRRQRALRQPQFRRPRVPRLRANYLACPPLVVAYALKGTVRGHGRGRRSAPHRTASRSTSRTSGRPNDEIRALSPRTSTRTMFRRRYADVYKGDEHWREIDVEGSETYNWRAGSTYIPNPPYFDGMTMTRRALTDIDRARPLAIFGDSITTDHISPAGAIKPDSPAGRYLLEHQVAAATSTPTARAAATTK